MDIVALPASASTSSSPAAASEARLRVEQPPQASFKEVLTRLSERMDRGEASVQAAIRAAPQMGPAGELLTLQAGVYQYTETFEVAAKMVDKATNAIKTTLQGQ
jgi:hypothetical protein